MFKKFAALLSIGALLCALCPPQALAQTSAPPPLVKSDEINKAPLSYRTVKSEEQTHRTLKEGIQKLVAEAKADKRLVIVDPQNQPKQSNSLSKGAKIAIVAGIAIVVILIFVVIHEKNHLFDDFTLGN